MSDSYHLLFQTMELAEKFFYDSSLADRMVFPEFLVHYACDLMGAVGVRVEPQEVDDEPKHD